MSNPEDNFHTADAYPLARLSAEPAVVADDLYYGKEWLVTANLAHDFTAGLAANRHHSRPSDFAVGEAVSSLVTALVMNDRLAHAHRDLDQIEGLAQNGGLTQGELSRHVTALQQRYQLTEAERQSMVEQRALRWVTPLAAPRLHANILNPADTGKRTVRLYHFADLNLIRDEAGVSVALNPVRDGGIDSRPLSNPPLGQNPSIQPAWQVFPSSTYPTDTLR